MIDETVDEDKVDEIVNKYCFENDLDRITS